MISATLAQADLFADLKQAHAVQERRQHAKLAEMEGELRRSRVLDHAVAARLLDEHDDYRVLRRLKPREVDASYRPGPGDFIAIIVDVEMTGLDHRRDEVIEIGMVSFVHDVEGRVGPVIGTLAILREPQVEITPEITKLTGITADMAAG